MITKINKRKWLVVLFTIHCSLFTSPAGAQSDSVNVGFRTVAQSDLLGGVSSVDMTELTQKNYMTYTLDNMQSLIGSTNWNQGEALVLVDGVPRDAGNVSPEEVAQVTFLKSAQAIALYGSRGAKGVILITTKRGHTDGLQVKVGGNATMYVPKRYPDYLGSAQYMTLYNEALQNDGLKPVYSQEDIWHYANHDNPYRYPEINFFSSDYVKKSYQRYDGNAEFQGGGQFAQFYTYIGFYHVGDLLNFGEGKDNHTNRLSVRGNIDLRLNDWVTGWIDADATFYDARGDLSGFWGASATQRPTSQYPLTPFIPVSAIDPNDENSRILADNSNNLIDGQFLLGGTQNQQTNPFAAMYAAGYNKYTSRQMQFDAGVKLDLRRILEGLSFKTHFAVDYATSYNTSINNEYSTYEATWNNANGIDQITSLTKYGTDKSTGTQNVSGSYDKQTMYFSAQFDYDNSFAGHNIAATLLANGYQQTVSGQYHRTSNANLGLQVNWNYRQTYYADLSMAVVHSAKLAEGHREAISPVVTLGWRLKNESWLRDVKWLDDLKLMASYGVINQDIDISNYYMYDYVFTATGQWWGWSETAQTMQTSLSTRGANEELGFVKRKEFRLGLNTAFQVSGFKFQTDLNYFNVKTNDQIVVPNIMYPSYFAAWNTSFLASTNYNNQTRSGIDFALNTKFQVSGFKFQVGLTGMYYWSNNDRISENNEYDWLNATGTAIESLRGYRCLGYFQESDFDADGKTTLPVINSNTRPGDLKYQDQNGDGRIDYQDMVVLGKWQAPFICGINITAKYKDFTLFVMGNGNFGGKGMKDNLTNWVYGDRKYTEAVLGRWTPETATTATYPRLTTLSGDLNFVPSDYWMFNTSAFYLSRVQLTYDFPTKVFGENSFVKGLQVYLLGTDLLCISGERKYLETNVGGGPQCRGYNLGAKISF